MIPRQAVSETIRREPPPRTSTPWWRSSESRSPTRRGHARRLRHCWRTRTCSFSSRPSTTKDRVRKKGSGVQGPGSIGIGKAATGSADRIAGYVVTWVVFDEGDLSNLAVDPGLRRRGIGRRLLDAAVAGAQTAGAHALFLEVRESNALALQLYSGRGFSRVGRRPELLPATR